MKKLLLALLKLFRVGVMSGTNQLNNLVSLQQDCELCLTSLTTRHEQLEKSLVNATEIHLKYLKQQDKLIGDIKGLDFSIKQAVSHDLEDQALKMIENKQDKEKQEAFIKSKVENLAERLQFIQQEITSNREDYQATSFELDNLRLEAELAESDIELYNSTKDYSKANLKQIRERVEKIQIRAKATKIVKEQLDTDVQSEVAAVVSKADAREIYNRYKQEMNQES